MVQTWRNMNPVNPIPRSFEATLTLRLLALDAEQANLSAHALAESVGAEVTAVRDVSAPAPGERRCERCGGPYDQPPADRRIPVCTTCLRDTSLR